VNLEHGRWGNNFRSPKGGTIRTETIFWGKGTHVGDWGVTVGVVITMMVVITVGETDITVGTLVVTVEEGWFVTVV